VLAALILALGLAMDAAAAGAVRGMIARRVRVADVVTIAALCGGLQGGMAALGWLAGARLGTAFARVDHWIAFGVLALLGGKAIIGALRTGPDAPPPTRPFALRGLVVLALATSIDALAAGVTVPLLPIGAPLALALIAGVTAALVAIATPLGGVLGARLGGKLEILGGVALIAIGAKILLEHLLA
jgi:putative Mn2+ efflux pump MntP